MGIKLIDATKESIGEQLFLCVTAAYESRGGHMEVPSWDMLTGDDKAAYMTFVNQIAAYVESQPETAPVKAVEPVIEAPPEPVVAFGTSPAILEQLPGGGDMIEEKTSDSAPEPVVNPLECDVCQFNAATKAGLAAHKRFKHVAVPA